MRAFLVPESAVGLCPQSIKICVMDRRQSFWLFHPIKWDGQSLWGQLSCIWHPRWPPRGKFGCRQRRTGKIGKCQATRHMMTFPMLFGQIKSSAGGAFSVTNRLIRGVQKVVNVVYSLLSGYSDTLWNLNFSRTVTGVGSPNRGIS